MRESVKHYWACTLSLIFLLAVSPPSYGVMPPEHYSRMAEQSSIKAVAIVESVEVLETTRQNTRKKAVFLLKHSFSDDIPENFSGTCCSVDFPWQNPMAGGTIYFYPEAGDLVYVTVAKDGGSITSYTHINDALESLFIDNPDRIRYGMGNAWLDL